jgi:hypothetical protein
VRTGFLILLSLASFTIFGCEHRPSLTEQVQAAGGASVLQNECNGFVDAFNKSSEKEDHWTNFPPAIASLNPQVVSIARSDGILLVDVQVGGGFNHQGLLICTSNTPAGFQPRHSDFRITKIADGVWEYRE